MGLWDEPGLSRHESEIAIWYEKNKHLKTKTEQRAVVGYEARPSWTTDPKFYTEHRAAPVASETFFWKSKVGLVFRQREWEGLSFRSFLLNDSAKCFDRGIWGVRYECAFRLRYRCIRPLYCISELPNICFNLIFLKKQNKPTFN